MAKEASTKVVTGKKCVFSYAYVFQPRPAMNEGGVPKYAANILIPKSDKKTIKAIEDAIALATEQGKASKFGGSIPKKLKTVFYDGDEEMPGDETYAGHMYVSAASMTKPGIVDKDLNPIMDPEEFYSGAIGRASLNFYAYNANGNKGIACGLNNIQKLEDGERLSGGSTAEEDFGDDDDDDLLG